MPLPLIATKLVAGVVMSKMNKSGGEDGSGGGGPNMSVIIAVVAVLAVLGMMMPIMFTGAVVGAIAGGIGGGGGGGGTAMIQCENNLTNDQMFGSVEGTGTSLANAELIGKVLSSLRVRAGDRAIQVAVTSAYAESTIRNLYHGHADSVGLYQQQADWAAKGGAYKGAWSGLSTPTGDDPGEYFNESNALVAEPGAEYGWAEYDSRVHPEYATKKFGWSLRSRATEVAENSSWPSHWPAQLTNYPGDMWADMKASVEAVRQPGMDDDAVGIAWTRAAADLPANTAIAFAYAVQKFNKDDTNYFAKAGTPVLKTYVNAAVKAAGENTKVEMETAASEGVIDGDAPVNGVLILGDSIAEGIANVAPPMLFGGNVSRFAYAGISARELFTSTPRAGFPNEMEVGDTLANAPSRIVVSLGTNSPNSPSDLRKYLRRLYRLAPTNATIYQLDVRNSLTGGSAAAYNDMLNELAASWNAAVAAGDETGAAQVVVVNTQDIFGDPVNQGDPNGGADGNGLPLHFSNDGSLRVWERVVGTSSGGDDALANTVVSSECKEFLGEMYAAAQAGQGGPLTVTQSDIDMITEMLVTVDAAQTTSCDAKRNGVPCKLLNQAASLVRKLKSAMTSAGDGGTVAVSMADIAGVRAALTNATKRKQSSCGGQYPAACADLTVLVTALTKIDALLMSAGVGNIITTPVDLSALEDSVAVAQTAQTSACALDGGSTGCASATKTLNKRMADLEQARKYADGAAKAVAFAAAQIGKRYIFSNPSPPDTWNCSTLTAWAWKTSDVKMTAYSHAQRTETTPVSRNAVQPGDIAFWFGMGSGSGGHVAIVSGVAADGTISIIEAASSSKPVLTRTLGGLWDDKFFKGFGRPNV